MKYEWRIPVRDGNRPFAAVCVPMNTKVSKPARPAFTYPNDGEERPLFQPTTGSLPGRPPGATRR